MAAEELGTEDCARASTGKRDTTRSAVFSQTAKCGSKSLVAFESLRPRRNVEWRAASLKSPHWKKKFKEQ